MNTIEKKQIAAEIKRLSQKSSQKKVAATLNISTATISAMVNNKWEHIADNMWRKAKASLKLDTGWNIAQTRNMQLFQDLLMAVQSKHLSIGISEKAGIGKSAAYKLYSRNYKNVIHIECKHYWSKKSYVKNLLMQCGLPTVGTTEELIENFLDYVKELESPLIIIDQADKLKPNQFDLFMDFYNDLFGHTGFVLSGVKALEKKILKGVQADKVGYREIWSRIGSKFFDDLNEPNREDVAAICIANGVEDQESINYIFNVCDGDLRKVRREVEKRQLQAERRSAA